MLRTSIKYSILWALLVNIGILPNLKGQDIHYSLYYKSPWLFNPAETNQFNGKWRVANQLRTQGQVVAAPQYTTYLGFQRKIYFYNEKMAAGLYYLNDKTYQNLLQTHILYASYGYERKVLSNSYLLFGLQAGLNYKKISVDDLSFPEQYDFTIGHYNASLPNSEDFEKENIAYPGINIGLKWKSAYGVFDYSIGAASNHIYRANESLLGGEHKSGIMYVLHGDITEILWDGICVRGDIYFATINRAHEIIGGLNMGIQTNTVSNNIKQIEVGAYIRDGINRNFDAFILVLGTDYNNWNFSLSYDIDPVNKKYSSVTSSAFEISIIFTKPETELKRMKIHDKLY
ncbi:MAG: PorP/SprF family type IX secretion system membrane protein [Bacteroidales bacterium]|nr:PorP/SprF family type IX secretion system membrane protein [Bacteroidales bacterium]